MGNKMEWNLTSFSRLSQEEQLTWARDRVQVEGEGGYAMARLYLAQAANVENTDELIAQWLLEKNTASGTVENTGGTAHSV